MTTVGAHVGIAGGVQVGIGPRPTADLDATALKYVPSTTAQWVGLGLTAPSDVWLCQESSGNLTSNNGTVLTAGSSPLYQQSVTGWTRKAVGFSSVANQRFQHATYNNVATTSLMVLMYMLVGTTPAGIQAVMTAGTNASGAGVSVTTTPRLRYRNGGNISDTTQAYQDAVFPLVFLHDVTNSRARLYTDDEKLSPTFASAAGTIFGIGTGTSANFTCLYLCAWKGSTAQMTDAQVKTMLQALRWSVAWSP